MKMFTDLVSSSTLL